MATRSGSRLHAYLIAVGAPLVAMLLRASADSLFSRSGPYLLFYPAIMLAAWYGGLGPGILATVLGGAIAAFFYIEPAFSFAISTPGDLVGLLLFVVNGFLIARLSDSLLRRHADQQQLIAIVESSDDAIIGKNLNGVITSWNQSAERLFGYQAVEVVGRSITILIPLERLSEEDDVMSKIRAGRRVEHFETVRRRKDGTAIEVSITVSPIKNQLGVIVGASKIARDISERRTAERIREDLLLRERVARGEAVAARDRLAFLAEVGALLTSSLDYTETLDRAVHLALPRLGDYCNVVVQDEQGRIRHVAWGHVVRDKEPILRELAVRLIETPEKGSDMPTFADAVITSDRTLVVTHAMLQRLSSEMKGIDPEIVELGLQLRPYAYVGVPMHVRGRVVGVMSFGTTEQESRREYADADVVVVEEFAERVSLAVENARLFRQAEEVNRLKDEFLATLSHELRTPLAAVLGWSRMLSNGQLDVSKVPRAIAAIERNAQAQVKIVDDILDVARGMAGNLELEMQPVDLVGVAHRGIEAIAPVAAVKQVVIDVSTPDPVPIVGDPGRLQQVVWNLLSNAVKFTPSGGRVTVHVETCDGRAVLRVTDTGMGIQPSFLPYVFDKFRQADGSFTRQHGGLGLGLAIARHLVELHGGSIGAQSGGEGLGATFVVQLPLLLSADASGQRRSVG